MPFFVHLCKLVESYQIAPQWQRLSGTHYCKDQHTDQHRIGAQEIFVECNQIRMSTGNKLKWGEMGVKCHI